MLPYVWRECHPDAVEQLRLPVEMCAAVLARSGWQIFSDYPARIVAQPSPQDEPDGGWQTFSDFPAQSGHVNLRLVSGNLSGRTGEAACRITIRAVPGHGVQARVDGAAVRVGSKRLIDGNDELPAVATLEAQGKTLLYVERDGALIALLAAADTVRPEAADALARVRALGVRHIELLTGDNEQTAAALAGSLGIAYRARLLPEDKIAIVQEYQAQGKTVVMVVVMVGDGVNDAPALAQADVGIAMGAFGTDVAIEAARIALLRDDWMLVPEAPSRSRGRTIGVVKLNIGFTAAYNLAGLLFAALGFLPPILAVAAQSLPDLVILGNSSRLLGGRKVQ